MADVSFCGVAKTYANGFKAIQDITLSVPDGDFLVLVGPSGCGKSTLLRMVAGLETISDGEIRIGGTRVNELEPARRDIAMVFQNYALYPHMSVYDNMAYGLRNRGTPKAEIERRVNAVAAILQLEPLLTRKPRQMSGGQRQRVAMGRAMVREPAVFLFDEPLSNLDAKLRTQMRLEIRQLQRRLGTTSIYVTHDQVEAMTMADRLVVMNGGVAEQTGRPLEVYAKPANRFVAGFIGSPAMNFLDGRIADGGAAVEVADGDGVWRLACPPANGPLEAGRPVTVGIRPEHLSLAEAGTSASGTLHLQTAERLGAETLLHGTLGPNGPRLVVRGPSATEATTERYGLAVAEAHIHLFDEATGARL